MIEFSRYKFKRNFWYIVIEYSVEVVRDIISFNHFSKVFVISFTF